MRKTCTLIILLAMTVSGSAWATASAVKIHVKGMVCGFCAQGIQKKFGSDEAVSKVDVNLGDHLVTLGLKEGKDLPDQKITDLLKEAGYTVEKIERN